MIKQNWNRWTYLGQKSIIYIYNELIVQGEEDEIRSITARAIARSSRSAKIAW